MAAGTVKMIFRQHSKLSAVCPVISYIAYIFFVLTILKLYIFVMYESSQMTTDEEKPFLVFKNQYTHTGPYFLEPVIFRTQGEYRSVMLYDFFVNENAPKLKSFNFTKKKRIALYGPLSRMALVHPEVGLRTCAKNACEISYGENYASSADVVIFDRRTISGRKPPRRMESQLWVLFDMNPPSVHNFSKLSDEWDIAFNWTMNYRLDSDIVVPFNVILKGDNFAKISEVKKSRMILWIVNDCTTQSLRERYVEELRRYIDVDIYGDCGDFNCSNQEVKTCVDIQQYRFILAFESDLCMDYVTDGLFMAYSADFVSLVPIVRGEADYNSILPAGTFINIADYSGPANLSSYLHYLAKNDTAYGEYMSRKVQYRSHRNLFDTLQSGFCDLCIKLHNLAYFSNRYRSVNKWLMEAVCEKPSDITNGK